MLVTKVETIDEYESHESCKKINKIIFKVLCAKKCGMLRIQNYQGDAQMCCMCLLYGIMNFGVSSRQKVVQKKEIKCTVRSQHNCLFTTYY